MSNEWRAIVIEFEFDDSHLYDGSLRVIRFDGYSLEWVSFIKANRQVRNNDYDIVIGPIANDDVRTQFVKHMLGEITEIERNCSVNPVIVVWKNESTFVADNFTLNF